MTNSDAAYLYRKAIAAAMQQYGKELRAAFQAWGNPIPPTQECMSAMGNAWGNCRVRFHCAGLALDKAREEIARQAYAADWENNCKMWRGF